MYSKWKAWIFFSCDMFFWPNGLEHGRCFLPSDRIRKKDYEGAPQMPAARESVQTSQWRLDGAPFTDQIISLETLLLRTIAWSFARLNSDSPTTLHISKCVHSKGSSVIKNDEYKYMCLYSTSLIKVNLDRIFRPKSWTSDLLKP